MVEHIVVIREGAFVPADLYISVGDTVVWHNQDIMKHTATGIAGEFDTGRISPQAKSDPKSFSNMSGPSGLAYECKLHDAMRGMIMVGEAQRRAQTPRIVPLASGSSRTLDAQQWRSLYEVLVRFWVYDMADDMEHAFANAQAGSPVIAEWHAILQKWHSVVGKQVPMTERAELDALPSSVLYPFGRNLRAAHYRVRTARHPLPPRPAGVQSIDPFGKAITIDAASDEAQDAYIRERDWVRVAFNIELDSDLGTAPSAAALQSYQDLKAAITPADYRLLGQHLDSAFAAFFGGGAFDETRVVDAIWRMTLAGEWDSPFYVGWHWFKWVEAYVGVLENDVVPDIIDLSGSSL